MPVTLTIDSGPRQAQRQVSDANAIRVRDALQALFPLVDENDEPITVPPEEHLMRWIAHEARRLVQNYERRQAIQDLPDSDVLPEAP